MADQVNKQESVNIEMAVTMAVNFVFNIVMLMPVSVLIEDIKVTLVTSLSVIFHLLSVPKLVNLVMIIIALMICYS